MGSEILHSKSHLLRLTADHTFSYAYFHFLPCPPSRATDYRVRSVSASRRLTVSRCLQCCRDLSERPKLLAHDHNHWQGRYFVRRGKRELLLNSIYHIALVRHICWISAIHIASMKNIIILALLVFCGGKAISQVPLAGKVVLSHSCILGDTLVMYTLTTAKFLELGNPLTLSTKNRVQVFDLTTNNLHPVSSITFDDTMIYENLQCNNSDIDFAGLQYSLDTTRVVYKSIKADYALNFTDTTSACIKLADSARHKDYKYLFPAVQRVGDLTYVAVNSDFRHVRLAFTGAHVVIPQNLP